nr:hypothetical protein CFP56_44351 [Quercus suber]
MFADVSPALSKVSNLEVSLSSDFEYDGDACVVSEDDTDDCSTAEHSCTDADKQEEPVLEDEYPFTQSSSIGYDERSSDRSEDEQEEGTDEEKDNEEAEDALEDESSGADKSRRRSSRFQLPTYKRPSYKIPLLGTDFADQVEQGLRLEVGRPSGTGKSKCSYLQSMGGHCSIEDYDGDDEEPLSRARIAEIEAKREQQQFNDHDETTIQTEDTKSIPRISTQKNTTKRSREDSDDDDAEERLYKELLRTTSEREEVAIKMQEIELQKLRQKDELLKLKEEELKKLIGIRVNKKQRLDLNSLTPSPSKALADAIMSSQVSLPRRTNAVCGAPLRGRGRQSTTQRAHRPTRKGVKSCSLHGDEALANPSGRRGSMLTMAVMLPADVSNPRFVEWNVS